MFIKKANKRAVTNIIATMIIFAMMIVSMGVLYSVISPTVLGFNAKTLSANQEFILLTIANEFEELIASPSGSQSRVKIISNNALYNVSTGNQLTVNVRDGGGILIAPGATITESIGAFLIQLDGTFTYEINEKYISRVSNENSMLQDDNSEINTNIVSKVQYEYNSANFTFYSKGRIDVVETAVNTFTVTIIIAKVTFTVQAGTVVDFPIRKEEFSLRMLRQDSSIQTVTAAGVNGPFTIDHTINGAASPEVYTFGANAATSITLKFITVPIHFSI